VWPHSLVVGINGVAVCVGTDDPAVAEYLAAWRIDEPAELVDFGLRLHPAQPSERSAPRNLPSVHVGSDVLGRSEDTESLRNALLRLIAAVTEPIPQELLRIRGAVLERDSQAWIAPEGNLRTVSLRRLKRSGFGVWFAQTVLIDAEAMQVVIDRPLGSSETMRRLPLAGVWLNHREPTAEVTPGEHLARLLAHCEVDPFDTEADAGARSRSMIVSAARLVSAAPVRYVSFGRQALENELTALFGR